MLRIGIIGLGQAAHQIHMPAYRQYRNKVALIAGCDIDSHARALAKKKLKLTNLYDDPQEMIEKTRPEILSICTPPSDHYVQCLMALEYGCHVFCEKPIAENLNQVDEIIDSSIKNNRFVVTNSEFPYMNIHKTAKDYIGSREFGKLLFLQANQTFRPTEKTEAGWRGKMDRRLCFEFGVHVFELIKYYFEENPNKLYAYIPNPNGQTNSEALNIITLEFSDDRAASIILNRLSKEPEHYLDMKLDGEFASIRTSIGGEVRFEVGINSSTKFPYFAYHLVRGGKAVLENGHRSKIIAKDGFNIFASATSVLFGKLIESIENDTEPPGSVQHSRDVLAMAVAAYDSAQSGKTIEMKNYFNNTN